MAQFDETKENRVAIATGRPTEVTEMVKAEITVVTEKVETRDVIVVVVRVEIDLQENLRHDSSVTMRKTLILLQPHKGEALGAIQQTPIFRRTIYHYLTDLLYKELHLLLMMTEEGEEDTSLGLALQLEPTIGIIISVEEDGEEEKGTGSPGPLQHEIFAVLVLVLVREREMIYLLESIHVARRVDHTVEEEGEGAEEETGWRVRVSGLGGGVDWCT